MTTEASKKPVDLQKVIVNLRGETYPMTYPSEQQVAKIQEEKKIEQVKIADLPRETIFNVLINCLSAYVVRDRREVFLIQQVTNWMFDQRPDKKELYAPLEQFLLKSVLPDMTNRIEKDKDGKDVEKGLYSGWVIAQVYREFGIEE